MSNERITHLEIVIAHLQQAFDELNKVVFQQQRELDQLRRLASRLEDGYRGLLEAERTPRMLSDEKPPHY